MLADFLQTILDHALNAANNLPGNGRQSQHHGPATSVFECVTCNRIEVLPTAKAEGFLDTSGDVWVSKLLYSYIAVYYEK